MSKENLLKDVGVILIVLFLVLTSVLVTGTGESEGAVLEVTTDKSLYVLGEPVTIFLKNVGDENLSAGGPVITIYDSEDEIFYQEACFCWYELKPGDYEIWPAWDQTDQEGDQVPVGCYIVEGFLSGFDENYVDDTTFYISNDESSSPPNNPDIPMGTTEGVVGGSYTYSTSTIDPDGDMVRYGWEYTGDSIVEKWTNLYSSDSPCSIKLVFDDPGNYYLRVMAEDEYGAQSGWSQALGIVIENEVLIVNAGGPYEGNILEDIEFDSTVTGGIPPYEYLWDYGDGNTSTGDPHPTHNYGNAGNYTVMLTVIDSEDDTASDTTWTYINTPPNTTVIDGQNSGKPGTVYTYSFTCTDPDGDNIAEYIINWGDGPNETITGPFISGTPQNKSHTWDSQDIYTIKAKAIDVYGAESGWATFTVSITKSKSYLGALQLLLQKMFQRLPLFEKILNLHY